LNHQGGVDKGYNQGNVQRGRGSKSRTGVSHRYTGPFSFLSLTRHICQFCEGEGRSVECPGRTASEGRPRCIFSAPPTRVSPRQRSQPGLPRALAARCFPRPPRLWSSVPPSTLFQIQSPRIQSLGYHPTPSIACVSRSLCGRWKTIEISGDGKHPVAEGG
jgi:hypothetical protein